MWGAAMREVLTRFIFLVVVAHSAAAEAHLPALYGWEFLRVDPPGYPAGACERGAAVEDSEVDPRRYSELLQDLELSEGAS